MCTEKLEPSPAELCSRFPCPPEALELAEKYPEPAAFIAELRGANMSLEAVQALARMLPPDKAVLWAQQSAQLAGEKVGISAEENEALEAARVWTLDPREATRVDAEAAAARLPPTAPAMWAARAAAWSEPMELPAGALPLRIAGDLTARAVVGAVQLSAAMVGSGEVIALPTAPTTLPKGLPALGAPSRPQDLAAPDVQALTIEQRAEAAKILEPFLEQGVGIAASVPGFTCSDPTCSAAPRLG
jgi:hypothetical protein